MKCCSCIRVVITWNGWTVRWFMVSPIRTLHIMYCYIPLCILIYARLTFYFWISKFYSLLETGLWNHVFLFSNLSLFVLLPFSYLFAESSGFFGHRKGIVSRFYETFTVFSLLAVVVLGITYIVSAVIYPEKRGLQTFLSKNRGKHWLIDIFYTNALCSITDLGSYYLPFLYSCVSFLGVLLLLGKTNIQMQITRHIHLHLISCSMHSIRIRPFVRRG